LCQECHTETQITGGFYKKLNPDLIRKYRDEWVEIIASQKNKFRFPKQNRIVLKHPLDSFLAQFETADVLPLGTSFYFHNYFTNEPGHLTIVVAAEELSADNASYRRSVLKAYLLCILGEIAPEGMLVTDIFKPSQAFRSIMLKPDVKIAVPNWLIKGLENFKYIQITSLVFQERNEILFTLSPTFYKVGTDIAALTPEFERIAKQLIGKVLEL